MASVLKIFVGTLAYLNLTKLSIKWYVKVCGTSEYIKQLLNKVDRILGIITAEVFAFANISLEEAICIFLHLTYAA